MATYRMTPAQRLANSNTLRKETRLQTLSKPPSFQKYLSKINSVELNAKKNEFLKKAADTVVRSASTVGDVVGNVLTGAIKGLEGIVDLGIGLVGAVGGGFDSDFQDKMKDAISYDFTGEIIKDPLQEALRYSYLKNDGLVENIASGVGQMLPAIAVTVITHGAGAPAAVSQIASLVTTGVSAAGSATEQAYQEGANYYTGLGYGTASGLVEAGTEKLFGGAKKAITGKGVADSLTKSVAKTGISRIAKNALEEGAEEVVAELASPTLKSIYKGNEAFEEYGEGEYWKNVGKAGAVGSLTALAYSGTVGYGLSKKGIGAVGKEADIQESLLEVESLKEQSKQLQAQDLLLEKEASLTETLNRNYQNIEKTLKSAKEAKREDLIKTFRLEKLFAKDGTFTGLPQGDSVATPLSDFREIAYSTDLWGQENIIQADLEKMSEESAQSYLAEHTAQGEEINIEQAREAVGSFSVLSTELSEEASASRRQFNQALNTLNQISGLDTAFVIVEPNDTFHADIVKDSTTGKNRIYLSADSFEDGTWAGALVHEMTHLQEGTKAYREMADFLQSEALLLDQETEAGTQKVPLWQKAQSTVFSKEYGFDRDQIQRIVEQVENGEPLTAKQRAVYNNFLSEIVAHETEYLLGNEAFIQRIVEKDASFVKKLMQKISHLKETFQTSKDGHTQSALKELQRAEKLYFKAAKEAGDMRLVKFLLAQNPELGEEGIDSGAEIRYNKKTPYVQWKSDALAWANRPTTKIGDMRSGSDLRFTYFYQAYDPDGDGRATDYRVIAKISHQNQTLIDDWYAEVKKNNERNHTSLSERIDAYESARREHQGDHGTLLEEATTNGPVGGIHQETSQSDRKRTSQSSNANRINFPADAPSTKDIPKDMQAKMDFHPEEYQENDSEQQETDQILSAPTERYKDLSKDSAEDSNGNPNRIDPPADAPSTEENPTIQTEDMPSMKERSDGKREDFRKAGASFSQTKVLGDLAKMLSRSFLGQQENPDWKLPKKVRELLHREVQSEAEVRDFYAELSKWYDPKNPLFEVRFDTEVSSMLEALATGTDDFFAQNSSLQEKILAYFSHYIERHNKIEFDGKQVQVSSTAKRYIEIIRKNKREKVGWLRNAFEKYAEIFADPMTVARYMDRYESGFYTEMLQRLRSGAVDASIMEMELNQPLNDFYRKNKNFLNDLNTKTVLYQDIQIPLSQAMLLYLSLHRQHAVPGLARSGFTYYDQKKTLRIPGFAIGKDLSMQELLQGAEEEKKALRAQFSQTELEYLSMVEKLLNETCREIKQKADIRKKGFTNATEEYYVPIRRANVAKQTEGSPFSQELDRVGHPSFNRNIVEGAQNELLIERIEDVLKRHLKAISQYANLATAIEDYLLLYQFDISGNPDRPVSIKTENEKGVANWRDGEAYFQKLIEDLQGVPPVKGAGVRAISKLRETYAKYQLGANPKVWFTQLSSFAAAGSILDPSSLIKGLAVDSSEVGSYCKWAELRNNSNDVIYTQGLFDKVRAFGDLMMKPIGMIDQFVVDKLFGACQVQVEKDKGLRVGTEENKIRAGELLEYVILETQQNTLSTERSSAMRSGSEWLKMVTMFSADAMKVLGRVVDSLGELSVLKAKKKLATDPAERAELNQKIKEATKKAQKSLSALVSTAFFIAWIAQIFRWLYDKEEEDADLIKEVALDTIGNMLGGLPIIRDIYTYFVQGYSFNDYTNSTINGLLDSTKNFISVFSDFLAGNIDPTDITISLRKLFFAVGQLIGIPVKNLYQSFSVLIKKISPAEGYQLDAMFYPKSYRSDLEKAIEEKDEKMITTIASLMLNENIGPIKDERSRQVLDHLVCRGYQVIPKSVKNTYTHQGVVYSLTPAQVKQVEKIYNTANEALQTLVRLPAFEKATNAVKSKAIQFLYDTYLKLALQDVLQIDFSLKATLFAEAIEIESLAMIVATATLLKSDVNQKGEPIPGSKKRKVQSYVNALPLKAAEKYMVMGYLGYRNTQGKGQVKAYIDRLNLKKSEKEKLLVYSGY